MFGSFLVILCYFTGSVTFGTIVARIAGIGDLRGQGSGNIGATNVARVGGKKLGLITLILDALKGFIPVLLIKIYISYDIALLSAAAVVIGHIYPVFAKFKGGKGVATTLAVFYALYWPAGIFASAVWLIVFLRTKISSLSAIAAFSLSPFFAFFMADGKFALLALGLGVLVIIRHRANIARLLKGEEGKIIK